MTNVPDVVYLVMRKYNGPKTYWLPKNVRMYQNRRGVVQFINANPRDKFAVLRTDAAWTDVTDEFV